MAAPPAREDETGLRDLFAKALPKDVAFTFYHISTPPRRCRAIFAPAPTRKPERTYCESHFLSVSIRAKGAQEKEQELMVMAIEINLYSTKNLTTLFVAKADSTGFLSLLDLPRTRTSPIKVIASTFVEYLVQSRQREGKRFVVSLFARAQNQYLFPLSSDISSKHVLDDRQLVRWWCRVLDPVLNKYATDKDDLTVQQLESGEYDESAITSKGYLIVPGVDKYETRRFFPPPSPNSPPRWVHGHPLLQIAPTPTAPPRCLVPRFPDDPKARYLDELDDEIAGVNIANNVTPSRSNGQWRSVKSLDQFWDMMAFRQECSSGRLVGFIWVVFTPPDLVDDDDDTESIAPDSQSSLFSMSETAPAAVGRRPPPSPSKRRPTARRTAKPLTGPIVPRLPRIKSAGSSSSSHSSQPAVTPYYLWPPESRGELVLSQKDYDRAHELLLHQNFGSRASAANSTEMWVKEVGVLAGKSDGWGWTVVGQNEGVSLAGGARDAAAAAGPGANSSHVRAANGVNTLDISSMRKKRKAEQPEPIPADTNGVAPTTEGRTTEPNVLSAGLIRKKAKVSDSEASTEQAMSEAPNDVSGVNVLNAGLVRKKPKQPEAAAPVATEASAAAEGVNVLGAGLVRKKPKT